MGEGYKQLAQKDGDNRPSADSSNTFGHFLGRVLHILARPSDFWDEVSSLVTPMRHLMFPHLTVLIGIRAGAGFIGDLLQSAGFVASLGKMFTSFFSWFALVWVFALIAGSIATTSGARQSVGSAVRFSVYGLTPLFAVGILAAIPLPHVAPIAELLAMPYAFYVLAVGVISELGIPSDKAPGAVGKLCGALLILWSVMPTLLPQLVGAIAG
jgi:hypothetical protein